MVVNVNKTVSTGYHLGLSSVFGGHENRYTTALKIRVLLYHKLDSKPGSIGLTQPQMGGLSQTHIASAIYSYQRG